MRLVARLAAALLIPVLAASCTSTPDVKGTTTVEFSATDASGAAASGEALGQVQQVLAKRAQTYGLGEPTFAVLGEGRLKMTVPGRPELALFAGLAEPGHLGLRKVLDSVRDVPELRPSPTAGATGLPSATSSSTGGGDTPLPSREAVLAKLGDAATVAASLTSTEVPPSVLAALTPFGLLTPAEVAVLPTAMQFAVPHLTCVTLNRRPLAATEDVTAQTVACDNTGAEKHLLDVAALTGLDIASAKATKNDSAGGQWVVNVSFTEAGKQKWTTLTGEAAVNGGDKKCSPAAAPQGNCAVAIMLDGREVSAPYIMSVITGDAQIAGSFTEQAAKVLAAQLQGGSLPARLRVESITNAD